MSDLVCEKQTHVALIKLNHQRARQEWDERYADLVLGKRNWQMMHGWAPVELQA
jgi:type IV secretory pathway TrbF-like protein